MNSTTTPLKARRFKWNKENKMSYIDNYNEWLFSDELDQHEKARLASPTEKEKEEMFYHSYLFFVSIHLFLLIQYLIS